MMIMVVMICGSAMAEEPMMASVQITLLDEMQNGMRQVHIEAINGKIEETFKKQVGYDPDVQVTHKYDATCTGIKVYVDGNLDSSTTGTTIDMSVNEGSEIRAIADFEWTNTEIMGNTKRSGTKSYTCIVPVSSSNSGDTTRALVRIASGEIKNGKQTVNVTTSDGMLTVDGEGETDYSAKCVNLTVEVGNKEVYDSIEADWEGDVEIGCTVFAKATFRIDDIDDIKILHANYTVIEPLSAGSEDEANNTQTSNNQNLLQDRVNALLQSASNLNADYVVLPEADEVNELLNRLANDTERDEALDAIETVLNNSDLTDNDKAGFIGEIVNANNLTQVTVVLANVQMALTSNSMSVNNPTSNVLRTADFAVISKCWGSKHQGNDNGLVTISNTTTSTTLTATYNSNVYKMSMNLKRIYIGNGSLSTGRIDLNYIKSNAKDLNNNLISDDTIAAALVTPFKNALTRAYKTISVDNNTVFILSDTTFNGADIFNNLGNYVFAMKGTDLVVRQDNGTGIFKAGGLESGNGDTIAPATGDHYTTNSHVYLCDACRKCETCNADVVFSMLGDFPLISRYCVQHVCKFFNADGSAYEKLACIEKAEGAGYCSAHTCQAECTDHIIGLVNSITADTSTKKLVVGRYNGEDEGTYSTFCSVHSCNSYKCRKSITGQSQFYCSTHAKRCPMIDYATNMGMNICNEPIADNAEVCIRHLGDKKIFDEDSTYNRRYVTCSKCGGLMLVDKISDGKYYINDAEVNSNTEYICASCKTAADAIKKRLDAYKKSFEGDTLTTEEISIVENRCGVNGCEALCMSGSTFCSNHTCRADNCFNQKDASEIYCTSCKEKDAAGELSSLPVGVSSDGSDNGSSGGSGGGGGGSGSYVPITPVTPTPDTCNHNIYPVGTDVTFADVDYDKHKQSWTCTNCKTALTEEYEHTFIDGTCICGRPEIGKLAEIFDVKTDLSEFDWASDSIQKLLDERVISKDELPSPTKNVTTQTFISFLGNILMEAGPYQSLSDVDKEVLGDNGSDEYYTYAMKAFGNAFNDSGKQGEGMVKAFFNESSSWKTAIITREKALSLIGSLLYKPATDEEVTEMLGGFSDRNKITKALKPYIVEPVNAELHGAFGKVIDNEVFGPKDKLNGITMLALIQKTRELLSEGYSDLWDESFLMNGEDEPGQINTGNMSSLLGVSTDLSEYNWATNDIKALLDEVIVSKSDLSSPTSTVTVKTFIPFLGNVLMRSGAYEKSFDMSKEVYDHEDNKYYIYAMDAFGLAFDDTGKPGEGMVTKFFGGNRSWKSMKLTREKALALIGSLLYEPANDAQIETSLGKFNDGRTVTQGFEAYIAKPIDVKLNEAFDGKTDNKILAPDSELNKLQMFTLVNRVRELLNRGKALWNSSFPSDSEVIVPDIPTEPEIPDEPTTPDPVDSTRKYLFSDYKVISTTDNVTEDADIAYAYDSVKKMQDLGFVTGKFNPATNETLLEPRTLLTPAQLFLAVNKILRANNAFSMFYEVHSLEEIYLNSQLGAATDEVKNSYNFMMTVYNIMYSDGEDSAGIGEDMAKQVFGNSDSWLFEPMTKGQVVILLGNLLYESGNKYTNEDFRDWDSCTEGLSEVNVRGIRAAIEHGILHSETDGNLNIGRKITKIEGITMLDKFFERMLPTAM